MDDTTWGLNGVLQARRFFAITSSSFLSSSNITTFSISTMLAAHFSSLSHSSSTLQWFGHFDLTLPCTGIITSSWQADILTSWYRYILISCYPPICISAYPDMHSWPNQQLTDQEALSLPSNGCFPFRRIDHWPGDARNLLRNSNPRSFKPSQNDCFVTKHSDWFNCFWNTIQSSKTIEHALKEFIYLAQFNFNWATSSYRVFF